KQQTGKQSLHRPPLTKNQCCQGDETTTRRHIACEQRRLTNREVCPSQSSQRTSKQHAPVAYTVNTDACRIGRLRLFTYRTQSESKGGSIYNVPSQTNQNQNRKCKQDRRLRQQMILRKLRS